MLKLKLLDDIINFLDNNYIIIILLQICTLNIVLAIILHNKPWIPFDDTKLLKSFGANGSLLESSNFGIMIASFALVPDLIFDIFHLFGGKKVQLSRAALLKSQKDSKRLYDKPRSWMQFINTDRRMGTIIVKSLIMVGLGLPAFLIIIYLHNDSRQCEIYCATTYIQNSFFAGSILIAYSYAINQPKYFGACLVILLGFFGISNLLYTLRDFYFPLGGHKNSTLEIAATIFNITSYITIFAALYQILSFLYSRIVGLYAPFSHARKFELVFLIGLVIKSSADAFYHVDEDRNEIPEHMVIINLIALYYLLITSNLYVHEQFDNLEASNDSLQVLSDELSVEKSLLESFLSSMVPRKVVEKITSGQILEPEYLKYVCVFYAEAHGINEYADSMEPMHVLSLMNRLFSVMDECVDCFSTLTKIQTSGNKYIVVAGLNTISQAFTDDGESDDSRRDLLADIVEFSLLVSEAARLVPMNASGNVSLRIGLHSGDIAAGLTGQSAPRFSLFGNTFSIVSTLESTCEANKIQVSKEFASDLQSYSLFDIKLSSLYRLEQRQGVIETPSKKVLQTFWLKKSENINLKSRFNDEFEKIYDIIKDSGMGKSFDFYHARVDLEEKRWKSYVANEGDTTWKSYVANEGDTTVSDNYDDSTISHNLDGSNC